MILFMFYLLFFFFPYFFILRFAVPREKPPAAGTEAGATGLRENVPTPADELAGAPNVKLLEAVFNVG